MDHIHDVHDLIEEVNTLARARIGAMQQIRPTLASIDERAARYIWVDSTCIAYHIDSDRTMQYYGGFEYVPSDNRVVIGEYVFYLREAEDVCERIVDHIERAEDNLRDQGIRLS
jgi:hypothetical protein